MTCRSRCITCCRCSRFYQEYAGGRDFGSTGSRDRVYFGRFEEGPLESPFSGNLVELLGRIDAVADDLTFYGSLGAPTFRVSHMTVA